MSRAAKVLQIGNYPPPMCGWAIQLKLVHDELRRRGYDCEVLKINEGRQVKSDEYVDVQSGSDYLRKIWRFAMRGYRLNIHVNGMSKKGYWLAMAAVLTGRLMGRPALVTFHGGLSQDYFPRHDNSLPHWAFYALFQLAGGVACDSEQIADAIVKYGIAPQKVISIATFSPQYLDFNPTKLPDEIEDFIRRHKRIIFSYVSYRPEYRLEVLREGMKRYRAQHPETGYVWLGFPDKEMAGARGFLDDWSPEERATLLLLANLPHDQFLTLLKRCFINLRTPACDGVSASVLESLALGIPVVASENHRRPSGVVTYEDMDAADMCAKLHYVTEHYDEVKDALGVQDSDDNVGKMVSWLTGDSVVERQTNVVAVP
jgi:glycosyltransferase involved in cell wall biosynthesis